MIIINNRKKVVLAVIALLFGMTVRVYVWNPNTQTVGAFENEDPNMPLDNFSTPIILQNENNSETNETIVVVETQHESNNTQLNMIVEKYMAASEDGPWLLADSPAGTKLTVGDIVFWKVEVTNIGGLDLDLGFIDYYDGYTLNLGNYVEVPETVESGETVSFTYKMHVFSGIHVNEVVASGTNGETTIVCMDKAFYYGYDGRQAAEFDETSEIPRFVVPEYPLGTLGGVFSLILAIGLNHRRKNII